MAGPNDRESGCNRDHFVLLMRNRLDELEELHRFMDRVGAEAGWSEHLCLNLTLACEELITNTIAYGYPQGGEHWIRLSVALKDGSVELVLEDEGIPFDPLAAEAPDLGSPLEDRAIGGLGIHFVKRLVSGISYERTPSGNRLVLVKQL